MLCWSLVSAVVHRVTGKGRKQRDTLSTDREESTQSVQSRLVVVTVQCKIVRSYLTPSVVLLMSPVPVERVLLGEDWPKEHTALIT